MRPGDADFVLFARLVCSHYAKNEVQLIGVQVLQGVTQAVDVLRKPIGLIALERIDPACGAGPAASDVAAAAIEDEKRACRNEMPCRPAAGHNKFDSQGATFEKVVTSGMLTGFE
ncbi:MAG: hypothetical protein KDJ47_09310 [Hyphomicrobiaceae bacterium]|nr:hypothetical protein [Hyphomicrobiaceae bacterium]